MNQTTSSRFSPARFAIGLGVAGALSAALGPVTGVPVGLGLAVVFGLTPGQKC
jgi:hypothetical protein